MGGQGDVAFCTLFENRNDGDGWVGGGGFWLAVDMFGLRGKRLDPWESEPQATEVK